MSVVSRICVVLIGLGQFLYIISLIIQNLHAHPVAIESTSHSEIIDLRFLQLESEENVDDIVNQCCIRESKFLVLGQDVNGEEIHVDVGSCKQKCFTNTPRPLKREEFDKFLKKYPDMDPIQIFLTLQNQQIGAGLNLASLNQSTPQNLSTLLLSSTSCISATCQPTSIRRQKHFSISGHSQEIEVIESCDCVAPPNSCQRKSKLMRFHVGTPYERNIDVGQCLGPCGIGDTSACRSVRNKTVAVEGPNGSQCFPVVEECQCVGSCFRTREFHKVYDYALVFENIGKNNGSDSKASIVVMEGESISSAEPLVKVIDVGSCEGTCRVNEGASKCLIWSVRNETCLSSLYGGHSHCVPTKLVSHFYIDRNGQSHSLISVTSCGCR